MEAFRELLSGDQFETESSIAISMSYKEILTQAVPEASRDEIDAHCELMPARYFQQYSISDILLHLDMIHRLLARITRSESDEALKPVIEWREDPDADLDEAHLVTWDRAGLFSKMAGSLTVAGFDISRGRAQIRSDHIAVVTFYVRGPDSNSDEMQSRFNRIVEDSLTTSERDILTPLVAEARMRRERAEPLGFTAGFKPTIHVYKELSLPRAIVEVEVRDFTGLLYHLLGVIFRHGYNITLARIATERGVAKDSFHIEATGHKSTPQKLRRLRDGLEKAAAGWENSEIRRSDRAKTNRPE